MGKKQKNALLDDGVCALVEYMQRISGASFPRLVTASLLKYIFGPLQPPESDGSPSDRHLWMTFAVAVEEGELDVYAIPDCLLERALEVAGNSLKQLAAQSDRRDDRWKEQVAKGIDYWQKFQERAAAIKRRWEIEISRYDNDRARAIKETLHRGGFPTLVVLGDRTWTVD
jgi:hypothetical protein